MSKEVIYMKVSYDEYELPEAVALSPTELARMVGSTKDKICSAISHSQKRKKKSRFIRVEIEMEEGELSC